MVYLNMAWSVVTQTAAWFSYGLSYTTVIFFSWKHSLQISDLHG